MATFTIPSSVKEGQTLTITASGLTSGKKYSVYPIPNNGVGDDWDSITFDGKSIAKSDTYYYDWTPSSSTSTISIPITLDGKSEYDEYNYFYFYDYSGSYRSYLRSVNTKVINVDSTSTGKITANSSSANEGSTVTFSFSGYSPSKYYYYTISGIDSSDTTRLLNGSSYIYSTGKGSLSVYLNNDNSTEGSETLTLKLYSDSARTTEEGSFSVNVNDTSTAPVSSIKTGTSYYDTSNPDSIDEGDVLYFDVSSLKPSTYYSWKVTGIDSADTTGSTLSNYFYNYSSTGSRKLWISTKEDLKTEGDETIKFELYEGLNSYTNLVSSKSTVLKDTSTEPVVEVKYGLSGNKDNPSEIDEGSYLTFYLSNLGRQNYYWKFTGIDTDDIYGNNTSGSFYSYGTSYVYLSTIEDNLTEGDESVTFTLSSDASHQNQVATTTFTLKDTSVTPVGQVEITDSNIRSNEGESAIIPLDITTYPTSTQSLYWKLSGIGLEKSDLATRFGDLSEEIKLGPNELRTLKTVRGTNYRSGSYNLKIPFAKDETTEGTETYLIEFFDNASLSGDSLDSANITLYDTSIDPPKSTLNSASIDGKLIKLYFSDKVNPGDVAGSYFKINRDGRPVPINSIKIDSGNTSASVSLKIEPDAGEKVSITYSAPRQAILQDFEEIITVTDINKPIPVKGVAYAEKVEMRFSEKLNEAKLNKSLFEVKADKRIKRISSVDITPEQGIITINLAQKIDINDDDIKVSYFDLGGNQSGSNLEDVSGNDVDTFKGFVVTNEAIDDNDISVTLAEVEESTITLGFDIELDSESIPNNGMFRVKVNNNKSKVKDITLNSKKREAYLTLKSPVSNGDVVSLTYIDAKGNQKRNVIQSKYGGDLGTFKDLKVENLSPESVDAPDIIDSYYDKDSTSIVVEFDEIISSTKVKNSRFKPYTINKVGKKTRLKVADVLSDSDDTILEIVLKKPIDPATNSLFFDYRDPKGDQKTGVIQDVQGNDLLNLKGQSVEI